MYPEEKLYTKDHEWLQLEGDVAIVGITDFAQKELGDVVYVDLPKVGDTFEANETFGQVESVKAVSQIFCPVSGEVVEVNDKLEAKPELVNQSPYERGWMIKLRPTKPDEMNDLLSAEEYEEYLQEQEES